MQKYENFTNFAPRKRHVPVVQWIEYRIPVPTIRVRLPTGIQHFHKSRNQAKVMRHWILLILFSVSLIFSVKGYFRPAAPEATDYDGVKAEYKSLSKRYCLICTCLFLYLIMQQIESIGLE